MAKFSRSNVSDAAFSKAQLDRSSYNLNEVTKITPILGAFHPVRCTRLMPNTTCSGSVIPKFQLEKVISPEIGRTRLDTHTFAVPFRRICNDYKIGLERQIFSDGSLLTLGEFSPEILFQWFFVSLFFYEKREVFPGESRLSLKVPTSVYNRVAKKVTSMGFDFPLWYDDPSDIDYVYSSYYNNIQYPPFFLEQLILDTLDHIRSIYAFYAYDDDVNLLYNYPKDFYAREFVRLTEFLSSIRDQSTSLCNDFVYQVIYTILSPYFGEMSNFDMLGYPIVRKYDSRYSMFSHNSRELFDLAIYGSSFDIPNEASSNINVNSYLYISLFLLPFYSSLTITYDGSTLVSGNLNVFKVSSNSINEFYESGQQFFGLWQNTLPYRSYSDFPLRAAYACWFDRMRDWHVENRSNCLDPDTWNHLTLLSMGIYYDGMPLNSEHQVSLERSKIYALCVPRTRFYADDALTTIKTDDKFRHIYSPILPLEEVAGSVDTSSDDVLNKIESIFLDSLAIAFPSGSLFGNYANKENLSALRNDLCLAKRAGMLERWLARNYFTPDNYNGFISAHFDTDVSDMDMLVSKYLGGSESMVSGNQQVADISTEQTVRGTRTFSGGVSADSSFSLQVKDYTYIVSFVSLVPLVEYDSISPAVLETDFNMLPSPEYANDTRIEATLSEFIRDFALNHDIIGYVPRYYLDRTRLDSVHGRYLTDYRSYSWFRDWYNMTFTQGSNFGDHGFALTPYSLRVNLPLDSFLGLAPWDSIAFGTVELPLAVNIPLSGAVEVI